MRLLDQQWCDDESILLLKDENTIRKLVNMFQGIRSVASSLGTGIIYRTLLMPQGVLCIYRRSRGLIRERIGRGWSSSSETSYMELLRSLGTEILKLFGTWFDKAERTEKEFLPPVMSLIVVEFVGCSLGSIDSELFLLLASIVKTCTLEWKIETLDNYHEHCLNFFVLIRAIVTHCLDALVVANFQFFMDLVTWAVRHTGRNIAESGLTVLLEMLKQFQISEFRNKFYKKYLLSILELIFGVLTDSLHKPGFKLHVMVLHHLFCLAGEGGLLTRAEPLWHVSNCPYRSSNEIFVRKYVTELITPFCVKVNSTANDDVNALFSSTHTADSFMRSVRNFLRQSDEFSEYDRDLFPELEEHDAAEREETRRLIRGIYNRTMKD
uniref:Exportin-1 C-terminal domain-containing protein n=1 Tax=Cannabis sativa TaxID=3483 RepID=A0A803QSB1_CANSA